MSELMATCEGVDGNPDIPMPIVALNRSILVGGVVLGFISGQPLLTTVLFLLLVPAVLFGQRLSPIARLGRIVLARQIVGAEREDRRLMRFNNSIALVLLGLAQIAFLLHAPLVGWILAGMVAAAATVALLGFCVGCFLYYQFKLQRYNLFGK